MVGGEAAKDPALVKSAFLCNFVKYTEWPEHAFGNPSSPVVLGVLGPDPLGNWLERTAKAIQLQGRTLNVRRFSSLPQPGECHLLFIPAESTRSPENRISVMGTNCVLTVSDDPSFAERGGMIAILEKDGALRFQVNLSSTTRAGLRLNAAMLKLADRVYRTSPSSKP